MSTQSVMRAWEVFAIERSEDSTPLSNTGYHYTNNTTKSLHEEFSIDWVSITFPYFHRYTELCSNLGVLNSWVDSFETIHKGKNGYNMSHSFNDIIILSQDESRMKFRDDMGLHLLISGSACRMFEILFVAYAHQITVASYDWKDFFIDCLKLGANVTRIDVAFDDYVYSNDASKEIPLIDFETVISSIQSGNLSSRYKQTQVIDNRKISTGEASGTTIYFGKRTSPIYIRFYDKLSEQHSKGNKLDPLLKHWQRYEVELKQDMAQDLVRKLITGSVEFSQLAVGIFKQQLDFKDPNDKESNKARRTTADWWLNFCKSYEKVKLSSNKDPSNYESMREWLIKVVSKSLYIAFSKEGYEFINELLEIGKNKI